MFFKRKKSNDDLPQRKKMQKDIEFYFSKDVEVDIVTKYDDLENQAVYKAQIALTKYSENTLFFHPIKDATFFHNQVLHVSVVDSPSRVSLVGKYVENDKRGDESDDKSELYSEFKYKARIDKIDLRRFFRCKPRGIFKTSGSVSLDDTVYNISNDLNGDDFIVQDLSISGIGFYTKNTNFSSKFLDKENIKKLSAEFINVNTSSVYRFSKNMKLARAVSKNQGYLLGFDFVEYKTYYDKISRISIDIQNVELSKK